MKNIKLISFIITTFATVALLIIGLCFPPNIQQPQNAPVNTEPTVASPIKELNVPAGTYYYILGTHTAYNVDDVQLQDVEHMLPYFRIKGNEYEFCATFGTQRGYAYSENNVIIFDDEQAIQQSMPIDTAHEEIWYAMYYPKQELAWQCTYDEESRIITIAHNSDFVQFKWFATVEEYTQYIREHFATESGYEIYPQPHDFDGPIPGVEPSH